MRIRMLATLKGFLTVLVFALLQTISLAAVAQNTQILLLVPDGMNTSDPRVLSWFDTAQEEGLQLMAVTDTEFLNLGTAGALNYAGLILPDQVHQVMADNVVTAVKNYVTQGGKLMLVYDAGALEVTGNYPLSTPSRFSSLAGVDYVLYYQLLDKTIGLGPIAGQESWMRLLHVPPGKSMPFVWTTNAQTLYLPSSAADAGGVAGYNHGALFQAISSLPALSALNSNLATGGKAKIHNRIPSGSYSPTQALAVPDSLQAITGYVYGPLTYPAFVTQGSFSGEVILSSPDFGLVAGLNNVGAGSVLFVNTPLSYLNGQTDGMLMHGFLSYFGTSMLNLPYLATVPEARGGLVLNWHVDSAGALDPIQQLDKIGVWKNGPFSIHVTAGPDAVAIGDGLGLNVPANPVTQKWIRYFLKKNHNIGSHGGWIHDYYGLNVSETNQADFQPFLQWNKQALENITGFPLVEYSAPVGNNPNWAMTWLENNGFNSYYFAGHTGNGPTRAYRDGKMQTPKMWAFPVTPYGMNATFEEFESAGLSNAEILAWYETLIDFSVTHRTNRLIYMHPPGAAYYPDVVKSFLNYAYMKQLAGQFRWYTMSDLANFNNSRLQVKWNVVDLGHGTMRIEATHPTSLALQAWVLPKSAYSRPSVMQGNASVKSSSQNWVVVANRGTQLKFVVAANRFAAPLRAIDNALDSFW